MFRKVVATLVALIIIVVPSVTHANQAPLDGEVYSIKEGEAAPYAGILLDGIAAAKMITNQKYLKAEVELELRKEFQEELLNNSLSLDLLQAEFNNYKELNQNILSIREEEISQLNNLLKEEISDYSHWWYAGGVLTGILLSIGIFYVATEISK
jgi:hypothetical protein